MSIVAHSKPAITVLDNSCTMSVRCHLLYSCCSKSLTVVVWVPTPIAGVGYTGQNELGPEWEFGGRCQSPIDTFSYDCRSTGEAHFCAPAFSYVLRSKNGSLLCYNFHSLEASRLALRPSLCASCGLKF